MTTEPVTTVPTCRFARADTADGPLCHCTGVTEATVREAIAEGVAVCLTSVMDTTGAGTGCRGCHCRIQRVLQGLPAKCGGRFDWCHQCGCINAICQCEAA